MVAFLVIGGVGVLLLIVSVILGDVLNGAFDSIGSDFVSGGAIAGFLGAFGFAAAAAYTLTDLLPVAVVVGLVVGVLVGLGVGWLTRTLRSERDHSTVSATNLPGRTGTVVSDIPADGYGVVSVVVAGHITRLNARSDLPLERGAAIRVVEVLSPTSVQVDPDF